MHCASCVTGIEERLLGFEGVESVSVNFATGKAAVTHRVEMISPGEMLAAIEALGYRGVIESAEARIELKEERGRAFKRDLIIWIICSLFALPLLVQMVVNPFNRGFEMAGWLQWTLGTIVQFGLGIPFYRSAWQGLKAKTTNMDSLVVLGTSAAYFYSFIVLAFDLEHPLYFDAAAILLVMISLGKLLEAMSSGRASAAIEKLLHLQPQTARVEREGEQVEIPLAQVRVGNTLFVRPGDTVPVDGEVIDGESDIDESMLTGESISVMKRSGDRLFGGTRNGQGALRLRATAVGAGTALAGIVSLVEQAQKSKAPIQRLADKISSYFVPIVIAIALATWVLWWLIGGVFSTALVNAVAVLVVACPCALGLAVPTVMMVASGLGAEMGILIKDASALEISKRLDTVILDKTGTLTEGKPSVSAVIPAEGKSEEELLAIALTIELNSEHPLARAIVARAKERNISPKKGRGFKATAGRGAEMKIEGADIHLAAIRFFEGMLPEEVERLELRGNTVIAVWSDAGPIGFIGIADRVRDSSARAVSQLKELGLNPVMITGDNRETAAAVAQQVGIDQFLAEVLPKDKAAKVEEFKAHGKFVGMVGDGINDAPALAAAHVGFAIGAGSDIAIEAADITLLRSEVTSVADAVRLARATFRKMRQNLFFAFVYNCVGIPIAAAGLLNPVIAGTAMAASSISVILNALTLRRFSGD